MVTSTARSTAPPPTVPMAVPSAESTSFWSGVEGLEPCRETTVASTTGVPDSTADNAARSTSSGNAVRGSGGVPGESTVGECTAARRPAN